MDVNHNTSPIMQDFIRNIITAKIQSKIDSSMAFGRAIEKKASMYSVEGGANMKKSLQKVETQKKASKNFLALNKEKVKGNLLDYAKGIKERPMPMVEKLSSKMSRDSGGNSRYFTYNSVFINP